MRRKAKNLTLLTIPSNKDEAASKKRKVEEERKPDNEDEDKDGGAIKDKTPSNRYKRTCWCKKKIPILVLQNLEKEGTTTMLEAIHRWGLMWQGLGWNFCHKHLSKLADHLKLVEVTETKRLDRMKTIWKNSDPEALLRLVIKNIDWFESMEKVWLYGEKIERCCFKDWPVTSQKRLMLALLMFAVVQERKGQWWKEII